MDQNELYDRLLEEITMKIIETPLKNGGDIVDVLMLLENIVACVIFLVNNTKEDDEFIDFFMSGVKDQVARGRLASCRPTGHA